MDDTAPKERALVAFVIMPFAAEFDEVYDFLIRSPLKDAGFDIIRADNINHQRNILKDIVRGVYESDLIVADLSTANPNVYYELGLAHAFGRPVVLFAQDIDEVPFDIQSYRIFKYSTHFAKMNEAQSGFQAFLRSAVSGSAQFGSPVSDFGVLSELPTILAPEPVIPPKPGGFDERGIIDYRADFEDGTHDMTNIIEEVGKRFGELTSESHVSLERANDGPAKSQRKILRALAEKIEKHASWMTGANTNYRNSLGDVAECMNALLSGEFGVNDKDQETLADLEGTFRGAESQVREGRDSFSNLVTAIENLPRIEREFNRAAKTLSLETKELASNVDQTMAVLSRARHSVQQLISRSHSSRSAERDY